MTRQVSDEVCDELRARIQRFLAARPDIRMIDLTHYTILSDHTGKSFMNGAIPGGTEVVREFTRVMDLAEAGDILPPGGRNGAVMIMEKRADRVRRVPNRQEFYETETVRRVAETIEFCAEHCTIGVITADYGVGKTEAVKSWRRGPGRNVETLCFEFDEFSSANKVDFVHQLSRMLGLTVPPGSQAAGKVFRAVCDALCERPCVLIFDQCETVRARVMQVVRQIWDRTHEAGVGVVLLAAPILATRMLGSRMADLGALTSRVGVWAMLNGVSKPETAAILKAEGITEMDEDAFNLLWHATGGSMRRLMKAIDLLRAKHSGKRVTERTVETMATYLWGMQVRPA